MILGQFANLATIIGLAVTAITLAWRLKLHLDDRRLWRRKIDTLETYLRKQKQNAVPGKKGQHTIIHLMSNLSLTRDEIIKAAFESTNIRSVTSVDEQGRARELMFEYMG